jgi:hypothetical protein
MLTPTVDLNRWVVAGRRWRHYLSYTKVAHDLRRTKRIIAWPLAIGDFRYRVLTLPNARDSWRVRSSASNRGAISARSAFRRVLPLKVAAA